MDNDNYKITTKIYGVQDRRQMIDTTAQKLFISEDNIFLDDRLNGGDPLYTAKKAYLSDHGDATHGIFLQDDVEVCDDFLSICLEIVKTYPDKIVSLFPFDWQAYDQQFDNLTTPYVVAYMLSACGIIMPIKYIDPCFKYIKQFYNDNVSDDFGIQSWANTHGVQIITTIPSLIQHIGDCSIIAPDCEIRRTVYYDRHPIANWSSKEIFHAKKVNKRFAPIGKNYIKVRN